MHARNQHKLDCLVALAPDFPRHQGPLKEVVRRTLQIRVRHLAFLRERRSQRAPWPLPLFLAFLKPLHDIRDLNAAGAFDSLSQCYIYDAVFTAGPPILTDTRR